MPDHTDFADSHDDVANVLDEQGDLNGVLALHETSLAIKLKALGPGHADVGTSCCDVANVLCGQGDVNGALALHEKALAIKLKTLGPDHADVAEICNDTAFALCSQGDLDGALALCEKALAITVSALGPDHASVGEMQFNVAQSLILQLAEKSGDTDRARELHTSAHRVFAAVLGPDHQHTRMAAKGLAGLGEREARRRRRLCARGSSPQHPMCVSRGPTLLLPFPQSVLSCIDRTKERIIDQCSHRRVHSRPVSRNGSFKRRLPRIRLIIFKAP